jgi:hypothetical protein
MEADTEEDVADDAIGDLWAVWTDDNGDRHGAEPAQESSDEDEIDKIVR